MRYIGSFAADAKQSAYFESVWYTGPDWHAVAALARDAYLSVATTKLRKLALAVAGSEKVSPLTGYKTT